MKLKLVGFDTMACSHPETLPLYRWVQIHLGRYLPDHEQLGAFLAWELL